ncbi:hypothetical protein PA0829 [Candidatus Phytoplasma australiense]|uniref:Uncharacterized protein n=1 Tax=Phytoplasma australiense TaxID=59748 RepID=B1VB40_PHYAS|nr:hypothetical protein PA0829 [Candidatus Phytoplasma australiense]
MDISTFRTIFVYVMLHSLRQFFIFSKNLGLTYFLVGLFLYLKLKKIITFVSFLKMFLERSVMPNDEIKKQFSNFL